MVVVACLVGDIDNGTRTGLSKWTRIGIFGVLESSEFHVSDLSWM